MDGFIKKFWKMAKDKKEELEELIDQVSEDQVEETENEAEEKADDTVEKLEKAEKEVTELKDKYLRSVAEFENYKRRVAKERIELMKTAGKDIISNLLTVLDDFERIAATLEENEEKSPHEDGILMVQKKLNNILSKKGLTPMESDGQPFDPDLFEALTEIPAPTEEEKGKVIQTIEKGYKLNDKIIRHARVVVGK